MPEEPTGEGAGGAGPELDPAQASYLRQKLESEQSLGLGVLAGTVAAGAGAAAWAAVTVATGYQIGVMAIAVGFLVGYAVRAAGKGVTSVFGVAGAALALLGCALGNLLAVELMVASFTPMDLLFYGIALYEGYRLSFRQLGAEELERMLSGGARP